MFFCSAMRKGSFMKTMLSLLFLFFCALLLCADEAQVACFNHYGAFFQEFPRRGDLILRVGKMDEGEILKRLENGTLRMAVSERLPAHPERFDITELAVEGDLVAVHLDNPLKNISSGDARQLLRGDLPSWKPLTGQDRIIHLYLASSALPPPPPRAEHPEKQKTPSEKAEKGKHAMVLRTENHSRSFILLFVDPDGAAKLPLASYREDRIKLLSVDGAAPTLANFRNGTYPLCRKIYLICAKNPTDSEKELASYIKSRAFAARIYADGALPLEQKDESK